MSMWSHVDPVSHIQMFITLRQWGLKVVGMGKLNITHPTFLST